MIFDLYYNPTLKDIQINNLNDLDFVNDIDAIAQICVLRVIIPKGSYIFNPNLGSNLYTLFKSQAVGDVTPIVQDMIEDALQPELDSGNIDSIVDVKTQYNSIDTTKLDIFVSILISNKVVDLSITT